MLLLEYLNQRFPDSTRTTLKRMVESRRVTINGRPARRLKDPIAPDDRIEILDRPKKALPTKTGQVSFPILHEDDDLIVVLKPPGLLTSTTARERRPTLAAKLRDYLTAIQPSARLGVIHRLDRDASGLLVFTKNGAAYANLKQQFFHHTVDRVYTAVIEGVPTPREGRIENFLMELPDGRVVRVQDPKRGRRSVTEYQTIKTIKRPKPLGPVSLLRVKLQTGRKHQIRAHFAARKTPIVGDAMYGAKGDGTTRLLLAATSLAFDHPRTGERVKFEVDPPKEITAIFPAEGQ